MLEHFKYFIILIVSTYYVLCISWIIKCLIIIDARCKHENRQVIKYSSSYLRCSVIGVSHGHDYQVNCRVGADID